MPPSPAVPGLFLLCSCLPPPQCASTADLPTCWVITITTAAPATLVPLSFPTPRRRRARVSPQQQPTSSVTSITTRWPGHQKLWTGRQHLDAPSPSHHQLSSSFSYFLLCCLFFRYMYSILSFLSVSPLSLAFPPVQGEGDEWSSEGRCVASRAVVCGSLAPAGSQLLLLRRTPRDSENVNKKPIIFIPSQRWVCVVA